MNYSPISWDQALHSGWSAAQRIKKLLEIRHPRRDLGSRQLDSSEGWNDIIIVGMGGSGIAGQLLNLISQHYDGSTVTVIDGPVVGRVSPHTLYIVCSYSGNTWETLHAFDALCAQGAHILTLTSGGQLAARAAVKGIDCVALPTGLVPRGALPWFMGSLLAVAEALSVLPGRMVYEQLCAHWQAVGAHYTDRALYEPFFAHIGSAQTCHVWGVRGDTDAAAYRLQTQLNENSKMAAVVATFPELNHNLLVGFTPPREQAPIVLVMTDHAHELLRVAAGSLQDVLAERGITLYKVPLLGDNWLSQCVASLWWADGASHYLGCARGYAIDATVLIDQLKQNFSRKVT